MSGSLIEPNSIKAIDLIYFEKIYPARTISITTAPDWLTDYRAIGPARYMDQVFNLVMCTSELADDIDNRMACMHGDRAVYADAIIHSKHGQKAAIKDATITNFYNLDITLVGGIFVLAEDPMEILARKLKELEKKEEEQPDLARFRHILEE